MVDAGFENQKELTKMQLDNQKEIAEMQNETQKEIAGIQSATSRQNTKDQVYAQNEMLAYQQKESTALVASIMENTNLSKQQQRSEERFSRNAETEIYTLSLHDALPILKCNWTIRKRLPRCKMRLKKRLLAFSRRLHARIRKTRYMHKMRCLLINRRSLLLSLRLLWKTPIFPSNSRDRKSGSAGMPRPRSTLFPYTTLFRS